MGRKLALTILKPFFLLAALPVYAFMRLLEPWRRIRVGMIPYERIGHLSDNTEMYLRALAADPERRARERGFFVSGPPANRQLMTMISRRLWVSESRPLRAFYAQGLRPLVEGTRFHEPLLFKSNEYERFASPAQLSFTPEEEARGRKLLAEMGVPEGAPFVCVHARDRAYLDARHAGRSREEWSYHDFRDCDIANYLPAAEELAASGLYVLRMGSVVSKPLASADPRIIDYASRFRSDFGDIYLLAHCRFLLGNASGPSDICSSFNVPLAAANYCPFGYAPFRAGELFTPKKYYDAKRKRMMSFREVLALGAEFWRRSDQYAAASVELVENSADEVLGLAREMDARLRGTWVPEKEDEELQARFRALFPSGHPITGFPSRVGAEFLRRNRELLG